jgi:aryl-alcohol dehydrogenase-like predicted oxidoreductase
MPAAANAPVGCAAASRLGLAAGRFNPDRPGVRSRGPGSPEEARAALEVAAAAGVRLLDAGARDVGAESALGRSLCDLGAEAAAIAVLVGAVAGAAEPAAAEAQARASLRRLGLGRARALMVRASGDLLRPEGQDLWRRLLTLRDQGLFDKIGVAFGPGEDVVGLVRRFKPEVVQLPLSLIDPRSILDGTLDRLAALGVEIHLRRVFHQGLLFHAGAPLPPAAAALAPRLSRLRRMIAEAGADPLQAALAFALGRTEAAFVIVGVASAAELRAVLAAAARGIPDLDWGALTREGPVGLSPAAAA